MVAKALKYLESCVRPDGGVYPVGSTHQNYETCCSIMAMMAANSDHRYDTLIKNAEKFVREQQWDVPEGHDRNSPNFGGAGYGGSKRPDLSNTSFLMDVLKASGAGSDDEAVKNALIFVSRCQNLESENNTTQFAAKLNDGGFYYTPASGGGSGAGATPEGGLRSYGAMTYAGLKCMIFAGVGPTDPRVQAAFKWIQSHYSVEENPGLGDVGLYYYYQTFGKSLDALGHDQIEDADGKSHNWRAELAAALVKRQRADGSWSNDAKRWMEGDPNLVTGYALITLSYCKPHKSTKP
jgi:squalene-hopene/tetraprenyl-beta-curcumene cyclase